MFAALAAVLGFAGPWMPDAIRRLRDRTTGKADRMSIKMLGTAKGLSLVPKWLLAVIAYGVVGVYLCLFGMQVYAPVAGLMEAADGGFFASLEVWARQEQVLGLVDKWFFSEVVLAVVFFWFGQRTRKWLIEGGAARVASSSSLTFLNTATSDTLAAARTPEIAGMDAPQAEAVVETLRRTVAEGAATKADLDLAVADMKATLYRSLLIHGGAMAALLLGLRLFA